MATTKTQQATSSRVVFIILIIIGIVLFSFILLFKAQRYDLPALNRLDIVLFTAAMTLTLTGGILCYLQDKKNIEAQMREIQQQHEERMAEKLNAREKFANDLNRARVGSPLELSGEASSGNRQVGTGKPPEHAQPIAASITASATIVSGALPPRTGAGGVADATIKAPIAHGSESRLRGGESDEKESEKESADESEEDSEEDSEKTRIALQRHL